MIELNKFMPNPLVCNNPRISNPRKSLEFFQSLDLERFYELGLSSRVIFYIGKGLMEKNKMTRMYEGVIGIPSKENSFSDNYDNQKIRLPFEKDWDMLSPDDNSSGVYFENELNAPRDIEFDISAKTISEYRGLDALRKTIIPEFFKKGYDKGNLNHTSIFWLYLGKEKPNESVLDASPYGLDVRLSEVDGIKVFTEKDIHQFIQMYY